MTKDELAVILDKHAKWWNGDKTGERANLRSADLSYANLSSANLSYANLSYANLSSANLSSANLSSADLRSANLRSANLSGVIGLLFATDFIYQLKSCADGVYAYKKFGSYQKPSSHWKIAAGEIITENCHPDRALDCACGVNVAIRKWFNDDNGLWRVLISWRDLADCCVPYNTDGKFRVARCKLIERVEADRAD